MPRNVLGRKLSCCWQDCAAAASDPGLAAVDGSVRRWPYCFLGGAANTRDSGSAICGSCPDRPGGIPDQTRSYAGGHRSAAVVDRPIRCRPIDLAETSMAGKSAHNTDTAVGSYLRCRTERSGEEFRNCYRVCTASPPMAHSTTKPVKMRAFYSGADRHYESVCEREGDFAPTSHRASYLSGLHCSAQPKWAFIA